MKVLIVYATTEGQTRKIARFMENVLQEDGHQVVVSDAEADAPSPEDFDSILLGASIHVHKYQKSLAKYIDNYRNLLNEKHSAFFSVCMAVARNDKSEHEAVYEMTHKFFEDNGWSPDSEVYFAGAVKYTKYNFIKRFIMRMISKKAGGAIDTSEDFEYTDWNQVKKFAIDFVGQRLTV